MASQKWTTDPFHTRQNSDDNTRKKRLAMAISSSITIVKSNVHTDLFAIFLMNFFLGCCKYSIFLIFTCMILDLRLVVFR